MPRELFSISTLLLAVPTTYSLGSARYVHVTARTPWIDLELQAVHHRLARAQLYKCIIKAEPTSLCCETFLNLFLAVRGIVESNFRQCGLESLLNAVLST